MKSLEKKELPQVLIKPSKNIAIFTEKDGNYGDVAIVQSDKFWETLINSEANINIDTTQPQNLAENVIIAFFILYAFTMFRAILEVKTVVEWECLTPFLNQLILIWNKV